MTFDPFNDFETRGYLHNVFGEKDPSIVKHLALGWPRLHSDSTGDRRERLEAGFRQIIHGSQAGRSHGISRLRPLFSRRQWPHNHGRPC